MTAEAPYDILLACPEGLKQDAIYVDLSWRFDADLSGDVVERVDKEWKRRTSENPRLYNGSKFRLANVRRKRASSQERDGSNSAGQVQVSVQLGLTDYRSFLGTNLHVGWQHLVIEDGDRTPTKSKQTFRSRAGDGPEVFITILEGTGMSGRHLANGLGNAAVVETADGGVVLLKRSGNVGEFPHAIVLPGGHPEPSKLGLDSIEKWKAMKERGDAIPKSDAVVSELFNSIVEEVHEETGIPKDCISPPLLLGFTCRVENHRPCMVFKLSTTLRRQEVQEVYESSTVADRFESTKLMTLSSHDLVTQVQAKGEELGVPGDHVGAFKLYEAHLALRS